MKRRDFLKHTGRAGIAGTVGGFLTGCGDDEPPGGDALSSEAPPGTGDPSGLPSTAEPGSGTGSDVLPTETEHLSSEIVERPIEITKTPWFHFHGPGEVLMRFESLEDRPATVTLRGGEIERQVQTAVTVDFVDFDWPPNHFIDVDYPDHAGDYAVHEVIFSDLPADTRFEVEVRSLDAVIHTGGFRTAPPSGSEGRIVWVSDTMFPTSPRVVEVALEKGAELVLHGGDIQYQTNPLDTWSGFFNIFGPLVTSAPVHYCIGNHEYEGHDEFEQFYRRLFEGQGDQSRTIDYHAFTWAGIRFLMLNSERDFDEEGEQLEWARAELTAADADPDIHYSVVAFHRPFFTFSRSRPRLRTREIWHTLFTEHDVPLVMTGHNHCYERFLVDGVIYIMDGGGGAGLYQPDANIEDFTAEEIETRLAFQRTHGCTVLDIAASGSISAHRTNVSEEIHDEWELVWPPED